MERTIVTSFLLEDLTPEQHDIATAAPDSKQLVTAGPGTGKTHVLITRLAQLSETHDLGPGELLVLSFTRSAVRVVRDRVRTAGAEVANIRATTFDSFATRLLATLDPAGRWVERDYDGRIEAAIALIESSEEVQEELSDYRHVIVDEMQDLVGIRAELVKSVLARSGGGFTLLGDPAQGIYNFQVEGEERRLGSAVLYEWVRSTFADDLIERTLDTNFRAESEVSKVGLFAGPLLNRPEPNFEEIRRDLITALRCVPGIGGLDSALPVLRRTTTSTAILCRNNGEALVVSRALWEAGVTHRLHRSASERAVAPWMGTLLGRSEIRSVGKTKFLRLMEEMNIDGAPEAMMAWRLMKRLDRRRTDDIDLARIAERIRVGNVPDELTDSEPPLLVVSTIHRAKGMEFDRVFLVEPDERECDPVELGDETRVLYVAMSRPKQDLIPMKPPGVDGWLHLDKDTDRWTRRGWGRQSWRLWGFEVSGDDLDRTYPPGGYIVDEKALCVQNYLQDSVSAGDEVSLHLISSARNATPRAFYEARHNDSFIGVTSERFAGALFRTIRVNHGWTVRWPDAIKGLRVEAVDTVAGTEVTTRRCDLGVSGIWLRARLVGLGDVVWTDGGEEDNGAGTE